MQTVDTDPRGVVRPESIEEAFKRLDTLMLRTRNTADVLEDTIGQLNGELGGVALAGTIDKSLEVHPVSMPSRLWELGHKVVGFVTNPISTIRDWSDRRAGFMYSIYSPVQDDRADPKSSWSLTDL